MKISILIAQRKQSYPGQYGLEALACMTEHDIEENAEYLSDALESNRQSGDFESLAIVTLDVREGEVRKILQPESTVLEAKVIP